MSLFGTVSDAATATKIFDEDSLELLALIKEEYGNGFIYSAMWGGLYQGRRQ